MKKEFEDVEIEIIYFVEDTITTSLLRSAGAGNGDEDGDGYDLDG